MKTHFVADLHLDHANVLAMSGRLFPNILEHDNHMIAQINRYVPRGDRLFILGDIAWHSVENYLDRLLCKDVHLIWGNHDKANYGKKFKTAEDVVEIKIGEHKVFLSHYPHAYWPRPTTAASTYTAIATDSGEQPSMPHFLDAARSMSV